MNTDGSLFPQDDAPPWRRPRNSADRPRLRRPERQQAEMDCESLDPLLPPDHQVRIVWQWVKRLDLAPLLQSIRAVDGRLGATPMTGALA